MEQAMVVVVIGGVLFLAVMAILSVISMCLSILIKMLVIALLGIVIFFIIQNYKNFTKMVTR